MSLVDVACPHCGAETRVEVEGEPESLRVRQKVSKKGMFSSWTPGRAECPAGHDFEFIYV